MTVLPLTEFELVLFDPVRVTFLMNEGPVKINDDVIIRIFVMGSLIPN